MLVEPLPQTKDFLLFEEVRKLIPNGVQTLSKAPSRFVNGIYPKFIWDGLGCKVRGSYQPTSKWYTDFICGLGPILLGYKNDFVDNFVISTIKNIGVTHSLPHFMEYTLASKLNKHIQSAEQVKFFKTGSEALSAAVRVARAVTGRDRVLVCGYHGWHDWYTVNTDKRAGIPKEYGSHIQRFPYNSPGIFEAIKKEQFAAVVMEPVVYQPPDQHWLGTLQGLCQLNGILLIFDEVVTGFRWGLGGAQSYFHVVPDLSCFSKAMGNGYPIAVLVGRKDYMKVFENKDFFVSGTFGGDLVGISAALAVIETMELVPVKDHIWKMGQKLKDGFNSICKDLGLEEVRCSGYPPRTFFDFPSTAHKALFWQECVERMILFGYANFISYAHKEEDINEALHVSRIALEYVKAHWDDPQNRLKGEMPVEVFRLR